MKEQASASVFNPDHQAGDLDARIVVALERLSEVFRVALWNTGKQHRISPLQIQLLIFLRFHSETYRTVSYLAREFSLSKPTISEAIRTLLKKELIEKRANASDSRSYVIALTATGQELADQLSDFAEAVPAAFSDWEAERKEAFYHNLLDLIQGLQQTGLVSLQRTCYQCQYLRKDAKGWHCAFLKKDLAPAALRVDCPEFSPSAA